MMDKINTMTVMFVKICLNTKSGDHGTNDKGEPCRQARFMSMISDMISDIISDIISNVVSDMITRYDM